MRLTKTAVVATGAIAALAGMGASPVFAAAAMPAPVTATTVDQHSTEAAMDQMWTEGGPAGWSAPWDAHPAPLISILDGAVINLLPWQICGSTAVAGVGGAVPIGSPNTVLGSCNNANTAILH